MVVAHDQDYGIGFNNKMMYWIPKDLRHFKRLTLNQTVVMGRKTWDSLPYKLPDRTCVVLSSATVSDADYSFASVDAVLALTGDIYIIGGAMVYEQFLPYYTHLEITEIKACRKADTHVAFLKLAVDGFVLYDTYDVYETDNKNNELLSLTFKRYKKKG